MFRKVWNFLFPILSESGLLLLTLHFVSEALGRNISGLGKCRDTDFREGCTRGMILIFKEEPFRVYEIKIFFEKNLGIKKT